MAQVIDRHDRIVVNWIITKLILAAVCFVLSFVFIGLVLFAALAGAGIVFPIVGSVKASSGEVWRDPCSIDFF